MKITKFTNLLSIGAIATLVTTGSFVISCGNSIHDQEKLNEVTTLMVANYLKNQKDFVPSSTKSVPKKAPNNGVLTNATINGVKGLTITFSNWQANNPNKGSVAFDVVLSKTGFTSKTINDVSYNGWFVGPATFNKIKGVPNLVAVSLNTSKEFFVGTQTQGLWVSANGDNFTQITQGIRDHWNITSLYQTSDGKIFVGTYANGLWVSTNGNNFVQVTSNLKVNWHISSIYQTFNRNIFVGTGMHGLWVSVNGNNFTQPSRFINNASIVSIYQISNGNMYVGSNFNGLWLSTDENNFTQINEGLQTTWSIASIYQTSDGEKILVGTFAKGLWVSTDGVKFVQIDVGLKYGLNIFAIYQTMYGEIFIGTSIGLWVSTDTGTTFVRVGGGLQDNFKISVVYESSDWRIFVGTYSDGLWVSINW